MHVYMYNLELQRKPQNQVSDVFESLSVCPL